MWTYSSNIRLASLGLSGYTFAFNRFIHLSYTRSILNTTEIFTICNSLHTPMILRMALCNGIYWSVIFSCLLICCCVKPVFSQTTETTSLPQPTWETQTQGSETTGKIPLYLGGFFSLAGSAFDASGSLVSVRMALEDINARPDVLSDYELRMVWSNTMVN